MAVPVTVRKNQGRARPRPVTTSDIMDLEDDESEPTDLNLLKEVSERLHLATRRPSTVQWKQVIEFRKSMGFYSTDVEPQFLDEIVGAKMKNDTQKNCSAPRNSPRLKGKLFFRKENKSASKQEDEINNNAKTESTRKGRSKSEKIVGTEEGPKRKNGISLPTFAQLKDLRRSKNPKSKTDKDSEKNVDGSTTDQSSDSGIVQDGVVPSPEGESVHCNEEESVQGAKEVSRFPLYDTDDENDDDTVGMSEMAIRYRNITRALGKIRRDLIIMRMEDNKLARKLLDARSEMNLIKVRRSCDEHAEMLDDVTYELEEEDFLPGLIKACDLPSRPPGSLLTAFSPLRNIGLSRMNLNRRRFSIR